MSRIWTRPVRLAELARGPLRLSLAPDDEQRAEIARRLKVRNLPALTAEVELRPWLDGVELRGRFQARVEQVCSLSLDVFEQDVAGEIEVRAVPGGSPNAPSDEGGEVTLDLDAPDPPDLMEGDALDPAAYVVEHLALELDPFPRKPGAMFEFTPDAEDDSPFAALKRLKGEAP